MSNWHVVYRGKPSRGTIEENLAAAGVEYYIPTVVSKKLNQEGDAIIENEEQFINNLLFVRSEGNITELTDAVDGLRSPMIDHATGLPAVVPDAEMQNFMRFVGVRNQNARILQDPYQRFRACQKVRVSAGDFEGTEGYVFRIRGDRKLIISLGKMAVAISGIHHTLLEPID